MTADRAYASPAAFRRALTDRLSTLAKEEGKWTLAQLQRHMAYDRLLERLYLLDDGWVVKGATDRYAGHRAARLPGVPAAGSPLWEPGYSAQAGHSLLPVAATLDDALAILRPCLDPLLDHSASGRWEPPRALAAKTSAPMSELTGWLAKLATGLGFR